MTDELDSKEPAITDLISFGDATRATAGWIELDITAFAVAQWFEDRMISVQIITASTTDLMIDSRETANPPQLNVVQN